MTSSVSRLSVVIFLAAVCLFSATAPAVYYPCFDCSFGGGGAGPICNACLSQCAADFSNCVGENPGLAGRNLCLSERNACEGACLSDCPDC